MSETGKSKGGRPAVNATPLTVRMPPDQLAGLDALRQQMSPVPSRPEIIRQIVAAAILAVKR